MVRIAGIDRDVSALEIMWAQADQQEKTMLALNQIIEVSKIVEDGKMTVEMMDDTKYVIQVTKEQKDV